MAYYKSLHRDPSLPDPGSSPLGPRMITREAHDAIVAAEDVHALAMLRGYLRSYLGVSGLMITAAAGVVVAWVIGESTWALGALLVFLAALGSVMQTRRRAHQWLSIVQARIDQLTATHL